MLCSERASERHIRLDRRKVSRLYVRGSVRAIGLARSMRSTLTISISVTDIRLRTV